MNFKNFIDCKNIRLIILVLVCVLSIYKPQKFGFTLCPMSQLVFIIILFYIISIQDYVISLALLVTYVFVANNFLMDKYKTVEEVKETFAMDDSETTLH